MACVSERWPVWVSDGLYDAMCVLTIQQSYACDKCDDAFTTQNKLKDHEELKHERVQYECDKCYDAFTTQNKLKDHETWKSEICL